MKAILASAFVVAAHSTCFASSVCVVSYVSDVTCDGRVVATIKENSYTKLSAMLKNLTDKGYRIVSQSTTSETPVWTLVKQ